MKPTKEEEQCVMKYVEWLHTLSEEDRNKEYIKMLREDENRPTGKNNRHC